MRQVIHPQTDYVQTAPVQYFNRIGALKESGLFIAEWGKRAFISAGKTAYSVIEHDLTESLSDYGIVWEHQLFTGECCDENIRSLTKKARAFGADILICAGGGKSLDTGKAAAFDLSVPVVCIPTIAATCAAASAVSVIYTADGEFLRDHYYPRNPELVIVDPSIIANAPLQYLTSGIIDALSKWYEGRAAYQGLTSPDVYTRSAYTLSRLLNDLLLAKGEAAADQVCNHAAGAELTDVIDVNIFLTAMIQSLGQASTRGAAAHPIQGGLSLIPGSHQLLHGVKVAYGIIVQLFMEGKAKAEIKELSDYFHRLGVTASLKGMGLPQDEITMRTVAKKANQDPLMRKMPVPVDEVVLVKNMQLTETFIHALYQGHL
ncbi:iron-containing alcohol dehydrogenase family protein [Diplocloster modestus]|uniref:Iron-containing alcohol dehydrogenase family protein n=1 Tax=Diplocloster modestus TaxID=2850322 RepID=A0ABS6K2A2_9FIRM|nr:iron-containing alcohol dehydrogenase family protein [Diplocloster modestus]MBU9724726.1 iron-containing alcohol dehydrogenase family protein [Diplocloster modestus]